MQTTPLWLFLVFFMDVVSYYISYFVIVGGVVIAEDARTGSTDIDWVEFKMRTST